MALLTNGYGFKCSHCGSNLHWKDDCPRLEKQKAYVLHGLSCKGVIDLNLITGHFSAEEFLVLCSRNKFAIHFLNASSASDPKHQSEITLSREDPRYCSTIAHTSKMEPRTTLE
eukprot:g38417.t1